MDKKYPRTMQEAFGPYTSYQIDDPEIPISKLAIWVGVCVVFVLIFLRVFFS